MTVPALAQLADDPTPGRRFCHSLRGAQATNAGNDLWARMWMNRNAEVAAIPPPDFA